jgi:hypothetical protein
MIDLKMPLPLAADTEISPPPTAADALAMLQADPTLTPTQRRDRLSALAAVVRICRPVSEGTPSPAGCPSRADDVYFPQGGPVSPPPSGLRFS